ncbi:MAG: DinB family protein [Flavobacteriales bacterium]
MPSRTALLRAFDRLEVDRTALIAHLDTLPENSLTTAPGPGAWTVAQVITHLAIAEESSLSYLRKKHDGGRHKPATFSSHWRLPLLNLALSLPLKYKAPAVVANVPATSYAEAKARWGAVRLDMRSTYGTLPEAHIGHDLFKHPTVGRFNLLQGLRFMQQHVRRHREQILRTLRAVA